MRLPTSSQVFLTAISVLSGVQAVPGPIPPLTEINGLVTRAFSDSPTGGYAPGRASCPSDSLIQGLPQEATTYNG
ncbi:unnamed protein product [Tuber melanosporum]|uniref:(Perigord truffle) hypothetical protein n=1 Tax=Tuber melanosporum (strain Mel28) TaxID=656061 RepID=D5GJE5_TUBMM|nr:uncharacterized protein GSTUM_00008961001 [Tuber melanosporum]CAZ84638.1 unnamed protein product [Tuber melanosporum]